MAVMVLFNSASVDTAQYEAIMAQLATGPQPAAGAIGHLCGFDKAGIHVVDLWESEADFMAFYNGQLRPIFRKLNIPEEQPQIMDLYRGSFPEGFETHHEALAPA